MINTVNTKEQQLTSGYFKIGTGKETILIIGSCRSVPYLNYFDLWNRQNGNRFAICFIDPFNWCFDLQDNRVDLEDKIISLENNVEILNLFNSTDILIHEYYSNFGMFNFDKSATKNIYQFGINPKIDVCIPNFNDNFILFNDIVKFDVEMRKKAMQDINVIGKLSEQTQNEIFAISKKNLQKFYDVCLKSDLPEFKERFERDFKTFRFFHTYNHISKWFTMAIFNLMNSKYLHLELTGDYWREISKEDMFANSFTKLTEYDIKFYGFDWGEEIVPLFS